jgi:large subunit ribosomal protein L14
MIQLKSILKVCDNSGALKVQCLKVYNKSKKKAGVIGDILLVSIKQIKSRNKFKKIKKKELHKAILLRTKKTTKRYDGSTVKFNTNTVLLLKKDMQKGVYYPIGTRIFGPISHELRINKDKFFKIISLSSNNV